MRKFIFFGGYTPFHSRINQFQFQGCLSASSPPSRHAQPSPAQPSPAHPSPAQPSPAQPSPAQPQRPAQPSPAQPSQPSPGPSPAPAQPSPAQAQPSPAQPSPAQPAQPSPAQPTAPDAKCGSKKKTFAQNFRPKLSHKTFGQNVIGTQTLNNFYKP